MKIWKLLFLVTLLICPLKKEVSSVSARSYIVMEQTQGEVLEGKDIHLQRSVASISKIMTAILAIESPYLFETTTIGDEIDHVVGSSLYLKKGTEIRLIDLVYGLLLRSGNDAAMAIAKKVGGEVDTFVHLMNQKKEEIQMNYTEFHNPHGLDIDEEGNLSCAYDMALLMRYCMQNPLFKEICSTRSYRCPSLGVWKNKHRLLHQYPYAVAGKTGFTSKAKRTLITAGEKEGQQLIIVTLDAGGDFALHKNLFEYYFSRYQAIPFLKKGKNYIQDICIYVKQDLSVLILKEKAHHLILIYAIDPLEQTLTLRINFEDGELKEYGPFPIAYEEIGGNIK